MKNNLSSDLHECERSNENASSKIYETLEIVIRRLDLGKRQTSLSVEPESQRQRWRVFAITI